ncbi:MAG: hypothetical protein V4725_03920 [Bacteroidota bacterium]
MEDQLYITSSCVIQQQKIVKGGSVVYESAEPTLLAFLAAAYQQLGEKYPKFYKMDNLCKLGWLGTEYLLKGFNKTKYQAEDMGVVLSNANSSLDADLKYLESVKEMASPALFVYTLPNIVIGEISIRHSFKGENAFFITEKFDAGLLQQYVSNLLNDGILQACICGWIEVLKEDYKAVLFLVEKQKIIGESQSFTLFTIDNLNNIYL